MSTPARPYDEILADLLLAIENCCRSSFASDEAKLSAIRSTARAMNAERAARAKLERAERRDKALHAKAVAIVRSIADLNGDTSMLRGELSGGSMTKRLKIAAEVRKVAEMHQPWLRRKVRSALAKVLAEVSNAGQ